MPDIQVPVDAWVEEEHPAINHGAGNVLGLSNIAAKHRRAYLYVRPPFDIGDTIISATLKLNTYGAWAGEQITAKRVTDLWIEDKVTWTNKPTVDATHQATATKTGTGEIDLDLTGMFGDVAGGGEYIGIELSVNGAANLWLTSAQYPDEALRPLLSIEWSLPLDVPNNLEPTGGFTVSNPKPVMEWDYGTDDEIRTQSQSWVQISDDETFATTDYDSGYQANTESNWDLALTAFGGLSTGVTYFWRVQVKDDTGRESGWSDVHEFVHDPLGTADIVYPDAATTDPANGDPYVSDTTPEIEHTLTGSVQEGVEILLVKVGEQEPDESDDVDADDPLEDPEPEPMWLDADEDEGLDGTDLDTDPPEVLWTYPRTPTPDTSFQVDPDLIDSAGIYQIQHLVHDQPTSAADRLALTNSPEHIETLRTFRYKRNGGPDPVDNLHVAKIGPGVLLTWNYTAGTGGFGGGPIDYFCLRLNGRETRQRLQPNDLRVAPGTNQFALYVWNLTPFKRHRLVIEAVDSRTVRGKTRRAHSKNNKRRYFTPRPVGIYLVDPQHDMMVKIRGADTPDLTYRETGTTYDIIGGEIPQRVIDSLGGYSGSVSGFVLGQGARNRFKRLKKRSTQHNLRLIFSDLNIPIRLEETSLSPSSEIPPGNRKYEVSFSFFQSGEVTWRKGTH